MPQAICDHCKTAITHPSTTVVQGEKEYCCNNCAQMASGNVQANSRGATCGHCRMPIVDTSTSVQRDGQAFCCDNCAGALQGSAPGLTGRPSKANE